jgi:hypothetical protein
MTQQVINVGASPNDGDGNPIRTAFIKCNDNFSELYSRVQESVPSSPTGSLGDTAGMIAFDNQYLYVCVANFDDTTEIWRRIEFDTTW